MATKSPTYLAHDSSRRTGRTTRMLVAALREFVNNHPEAMYIQAYDSIVCLYIKHKFQGMLDALSIPYTVLPSTNRIRIDNSTVHFVTRFNTFEGVPDSIPLFVDHYRGR